MANVTIDSVTPMYTPDGQTDRQTDRQTGDRQFRRHCFAYTMPAYVNKYITSHSADGPALYFAYRPVHRCER